VNNRTREIKLENIGTGLWKVRTLSCTEALALADNELQRYKWENHRTLSDKMVWKRESSTMIST